MNTAAMKCGKMTYRIPTPIDGYYPLLTTGTIIPAGSTKRIDFVSLLDDISSTKVTQTGASVTLVWSQN